MSTEQIQTGSGQLGLLGLAAKKEKREKKVLLFVQSNYFIFLRSENVDHGSDEFDLRPLCSNIRCYNQRVSNLADY